MTKDEVLNGYQGLTGRESVTHQVGNWADGIPTHNPIRDECCPDFSCCDPALLMDESLRKRFLKSHVSEDYETRDKILGMALSAAFPTFDEDVDVCVDVWGDDPVEH